MKEAHGEFIELYDEGGSLIDYEYVVKGHVSGFQFRAELAAWWRAEYGDGCPETERPRHLYGRWSCEGNGADEVGCVLFRRYRNPGPGRFPVTVAEASWSARSRERERRRASRARQRILRSFLESSIVRTSGGSGPGTESVVFQVPGLVADVTWHARHRGQVWVQARDVEAWNAYAARTGVAPAADGERKAAG